MAKFERAQVAQIMQETGIIPVFYHAEIDTALAVVRACYNGGVRAFEFTNRGDLAHEVFTAIIKEARSTMPGLALGVGTILDAGTASLYLQLGADFLVMPFFTEEVARTCNRRKVLWAAGCNTLTEISRAEEFGAEIVKVFPGNILGPKFISSARGPMPWSKLMPTGGVEPTFESLKSWFDAGACCVGIGSQLFPKKFNSTADFEKVKERCAFSINTIKQLRGLAE